MRLLYRYEQLTQDFWFSISVEPSLACEQALCLQAKPSCASPVITATATATATTFWGESFRIVYRL